MTCDSCWNRESYSYKNSIQHRWSLAICSKLYNKPDYIITGPRMLLCGRDNHNLCASVQACTWNPDQKGNAGILRLDPRVLVFWRRTPKHSDQRFDSDGHKPWQPQTMTMMTTTMTAQTMTTTNITCPTMPWIFRFLKSTSLVFHVFITVAVMV